MNVERPRATLTLRAPKTWSAKDRRAVIAWLRKSATQLGRAQYAACTRFRLYGT